MKKKYLWMLFAILAHSLSVSAQNDAVFKLTICGRQFKGVTVGVSPFKSLDEYGFLGLKFFTIPTIFDFSEKKLYLCK